MLYISIVALLAFSAFFSASETAISTYNKIRIRKQAQDGDERAKTALHLSERYDKTLTSILIGNNMVNIAGSTIGAVIFTALLGPSGAVVSTVAMTLLVLIFGEILPKSYSGANADRVALRIAKPLRWIGALLTPLTWIFTRLSGNIARTGDEQEKTPTITEEELLYFIESIEEEGVLEEEESNLVQSALEFDEITIREIITPRVNLVALEVDSTTEQAKEVLLGEKHSLIPVYEGSVDNIIGILPFRDAMCSLVRGEELDIRALLKEPYFVHKGMKLSKLLAIFQNRAIRMAVVLDEYGGTLGIVTISDLLGELVGDLWEEEEEPETIIPSGDGSYEIMGGCELWDLIEELGLDEDAIGSDYSTVNGWALHHMGHIPGIGEGFEFAGWRFDVMEMDGRRINRLSAKRVPPEKDGAATAGEE